MDPIEELTALWSEMFGEPPSIVADCQTMARVMVRHLDPAPPYRPKPNPGGDGAS